MADISIGDVTARLRVDLTDWQRGLQQAQQQLAQFAQTVQRTLATVTPRVDTAEFQRGLNQAQQQLSQFAQQMQRSVASSTLRLDNAAFTRSLQQAQQQLTAFTAQQRQLSPVRLQVDTAALTAGLQQATQQLQQFNLGVQQTGQVTAQASQQFRGAAQATSAWSGALQVAAGLGIATSIGAIVSQMVAFGQSVVRVGTDLQQLRASLSNVTGGVTQGQQAFTFITDTANRYGLSLTTLAQSYRSLAAATRGTALEGEGAQRLFTALAAASRAYGLSSDQTGRALLAFQQIISKGKVTQEELRQQLGEALPGAVQMAARAFGVTTQQLDVMIAKGYDGIEFIRRFIPELEKVPQAAKGVEGAANAFNRLGNEIFLLKDKIAQSGLIKFLSEAAAGLATLLETDRKAAEQRERFIKGRAEAGVRPGGMEAAPQEAAKLLQATERLTRAEEELRVVQEARQQEGPMSGRMEALSQRRLAEVQQRIEAARQEKTALEATIEARRQASLTTGLDIEGRPIAEFGTMETLRAREKDREAANQALQTQLKGTSSAIDDVNKKAAETPVVFGSLTGNATQQLTLLNERIKVTREQLEKVTETIVGRRPELGPVPPELQQQKVALEQQLQVDEARKKGIEDAAAAAKKATSDVDQARKQADREAEADRKKALQDQLQAIRERIQAEKQAANQEISLRQDVARVTAFVAGPEENVARQAQARVQAQGAAMQEVIDKALQQFEESATLTQLAPGLLQQLQALKESLPGAIEAQGLKAFDEAIRQNAVLPLEQLAQAYGMTKEARDADKASTLEAMAVGTQYEAQTKKLADTIRAAALAEAKYPELKRQAEASAPAGEAALKAVQDEAEALQTLRENLEQARIPRDQQGFPFGRTREELRLQQRTQEAIISPAGRQQAQAIQEARLAQEQLNYAVGIFEDFAGSVGQAWFQALTGIIQGTASVSEAFRAMGKSILDTMAQIAAQEATKAFIGLGVSLLTSAFAPGVAAGAGGGGAGGGLGTLIGQALGSQVNLATGAGGGGGYIQPSPYAVDLGLTGMGGGGGLNIPDFQHGGMINRPTLAMIGEGPSNTLPEFVLNRQQMASVMDGGMRQGGGSERPISIINVASREQAEQTAAQERSLGREVVLNYIMQDLSQGEGSKVHQMMRKLQR